MCEGLSLRLIFDIYFCYFEFLLYPQGAVFRPLTLPQEQNLSESEKRSPQQPERCPSGLARCLRLAAPAVVMARAPVGKRRAPAHDAVGTAG